MLYVGFLCFLGTSEMMALQFLHLIPDRRSHRVTVIIPFAKTSMGNPQGLVFEDERAHALAVTVLAAREPTYRLWPSTPTIFRLFWNSLVEDYVP